VTVTGVPATRSDPADAASTPRSLAISAAAGVSAVLVILGVAIALFFNPAWVAFEQGRSAVDLWTGWDAGTVRTVTDSVVVEVFLGPGTFAQTAGGVPVFTAAEAGHMADVRGVLMAFALVVLLALVVLVATWVVDRRRIAFWRGVAIGAAALGVAVVTIGVFLLLFFDLAFEAFHRIFFAAGSYTFDPRTDRLVQLFPETFWTETSIALAVVVLALAAIVGSVAHVRRRAAVRRSAAR
jgi:integral membrane protein (TIGR01906 family)